MIKEIILENKDDSTIYSGVYLMNDGSYQWLTASQSGTCKTLKTAMKKVNHAL